MTALGGCGGADADSEGERRNEELPIEFSVKIDGDLTGTLKQTAKSYFIYTTDPDPADLELQLFGIEPIEPVLRDGVLLKVGLAVNPFRGDGTYTIPVGAPSDAPKDENEQKARNRSSIKVEWWPGGDVANSPLQFMRRLEPCTARVRDKGEAGKLECPAVTGDDPSTRFSLVMEWKVAAPA